MPGAAFLRIFRRDEPSREIQTVHRPAAFATRQYAKLRDGFEDYLHQRYRAHLVPGLFDVIESGASSGALGGFLSGSGSTIACLTLSGNEDAVAAAMLKGWKGTAAAETRILTADNLGATVLHVE